LGRTAGHCDAVSYPRLAVLELNVPTRSEKPNKILAQKKLQGFLVANIETVAQLLIPRHDP
jgi:hypothetical protein